MDKTLKAALMTYVSMLLFIVIAIIYVKSNNEIKVDHFAAIPQTVGADGRYTAGSQEFYVAHISPSLTWDIEQPSVWLILGIVVLAVAGIFLALWATDRIQPDRGSGGVMTFGFFAVAATMIFAAFSTRLANTTIQLTPEQYEAVKGNQKAMEQLFINKEKQ